MAHPPDRCPERNTAAELQKPSRNQSRLKNEWLQTKQNQIVLGKVDPEKGNHLIDSRINQPESVAMAHPRDHSPDKNTTEQKLSRDQNRLKNDWQQAGQNQGVLGKVDPEKGNRLIDYTAAVQQKP